MLRSGVTVALAPIENVLNILMKEAVCTRKNKRKSRFGNSSPIHLYIYRSVFLNNLFRINFLIKLEQLTKNSKFREDYGDREIGVPDVHIQNRFLTSGSCFKDRYFALYAYIRAA